jgi:hypothetical protein
MNPTRKVPQFLALITIMLFMSSSINAQEKMTFSGSTASTKKITTEYFLNYFKLNFDAMKESMHDDVSFHDPTAELIMGSKLVEGKTNVYEGFKKNYAAL